jgi:uncharacterized protein DUF4340
VRTSWVALLVALGVVAIAGGRYFGAGPTSSEPPSIAGGHLMFPDLAPKLRDAAKIEISHQGKQTVIEKRPDGGWGIASMHDYPVQESRLRGVLAGLTELRLTEPRTTDQAMFGRLGVDDPNGPTSTANLLRVLDATGKPILAVIVGHRRVRSLANAPEEVYVRRPDENQSWLAEGNLQVDADASLWLDRDIMNIAQNRIASVVVGEQALTFARVDGKFGLTQPTDHPKLEDYKVEDVARALETLTLQQVRADADAPVVEATGVQPGHAVFTTDDGLVVTVRLFHADKDLWARFTASASSDKVKAEAERLNRLVAGWSYQIGSWKEKSLVPNMDDLKVQEPANHAPDSRPDAPPDTGPDLGPDAGKK